MTLIASMLFDLRMVTNDNEDPFQPLARANALVVMRLLFDQFNEPRKGHDTEIRNHDDETDRQSCEGPEKFKRA